MLLTGEVGRWQATGHCSPEIQRDPVHYQHPSVPTSPSSTRISDAMAPLNRTLKSWVSRGHPLHLCPSRPQFCRPGFEGPQCHESLNWFELGLHDRNIIGHIQDHRAPHPRLRLLHLVHPSILNTPGQA